jgi:hypothetical protein
MPSIFDFLSSLCRFIAQPTGLVAVELFPPAGGSLHRRPALSGSFTPLESLSTRDDRPSALPSEPAHLQPTAYLTRVCFPSLSAVSQHIQRSAVRWLAHVCLLEMSLPKAARQTDWASPCDCGRTSQAQNIHVARLHLSQALAALGPTSTYRVSSWAY